MKPSKSHMGLKHTLMISAAGLLVLSGCSQDEGTGAGPEAGGAGGFDTGSLVGVALAEDSADTEKLFTDQITESNFEPQVQTASDRAEQQEQLSTMLEGNPEVLIIDAVDPAGLGDLLDAAKEKGVHIVAFDTLPRGTSSVDYFVSEDVFQTGAGQAQALLDGLAKRHGEGPYNVELFSGDAEDKLAQTAFDGAMSVLQPAIDEGTVAVASGQESFEDTATKGAQANAAVQRFEGLLSDTYRAEKLHGVLTVDDAVAHALLDASDSKDMLVVGAGSAPQAVESIMKDEQYATTYADPNELVSQAVSIVRRLSQDDEPAPDNDESYDNGQKTVPAFLVESETVTRENAAEVYADNPELSPLTR